ncbi:hypothetical protein CULT_80085 [[Clostridium] ultunense Esp]|uniref:hypothetical protein n=1 Tax=Thermicanus aegyptius TaxID=94009 RepID=UPI0002B6F0FC|nr:hypothetical protein [Thermicanus aegyptius]CCQ98181.1 hypothetical protein CULT_80085 [[Clostridium] ultunense Esp]
MKAVIPFVLLALVALSGCSFGIVNLPNEQHDNSDPAKMETWLASPAFQLEAVNENNEKVITTAFGEKEHLAVIPGSILAGVNAKMMWLFWGEADQLVGKKVKFMAVSQTGERMEFGGAYEDSLSGENWGAPASILAYPNFPSSGLWKIEVTVDDKPFGEVVLEVKEEA